MRSLVSDGAGVVSFAGNNNTTMDKNLRIVFMGTPEFAVATLAALVEGGWNVVGVVTQPDKPVGRHGSVLQAPAVKQYAEAHGLPVLQPVKMKDPAFIESLAAFRADIQVVVAFRMLPEVVWAMPRYGTFNVHAALLPQYRGAAPINWAIINGETETGVTTFFLDHNIDTGRIILQKPMPIPRDADVEYVYDRLMRLGAEAAVETLQRVVDADGAVESVPQPEAGDLHPAPKLFNDTCRTDWQQPAERVRNFIRGLSPAPRAWAVMRRDADDAGTVWKLYASETTTEPCHELPGTLRAEHGRLYAATADCWLELTSVQPAGKKRMAARDLLNGMKTLDGCRLG